MMEERPEEVESSGEIKDPSLHKGVIGEIKEGGQG